MSSSRRAWIVAASVGVVEALKDQGICRWNHTIRSAHQYAKNHVRSVPQATRLTGSSAAVVSSKQQQKQSEESLRTPPPERISARLYNSLLNHSGVGRKKSPVGSLVL
uniref:Wound-responsive family protein n=1 Tax=Cucumis sativus TaxID=3659 RepID=A0A0A0K296_CUCSA